MYRFCHLQLLLTQHVFERERSCVYYILWLAIPPACFSNEPWSARLPSESKYIPGAIEVRALIQPNIL